MPKPIVLSGIKPTGSLNIGGYLGAVKNWVDLQNSGRYQLYIFIADLHALTTESSADGLRALTSELAADLVALGIDHKKTCLFVQSHVPEHAELAWIFNCLTPLAELGRMTQFKDKSQKQEKNINAGLFTYPVLQAADILLYHATKVPVGQDQIQHVELTRDIARWFNNRYGDYFPTVDPLLTEIPKVMSLLEPTKKMSKSDGNEHNAIELADEPKMIEAKLKKAITATEGGGRAPGVENLLTLLKQFGDEKTYEKFVKTEKAGTIRYGDLKQELAGAIADYFADFRDRRSALLNDPARLSKILADGAKRASLVARQTMNDVRTLVGIR